jgi:cation transport ATPase
MGGIRMNTEFDSTGKHKFDSEKLKRAIDVVYNEEISADKGIDESLSFQNEMEDQHLRRTGTDFSAVPTGAKATKSKARSGAREEESQKRTEILCTLDKRIFSGVSRLIFCIFALVLLIWIEVGAVFGFILPVYVSINSNIYGFVIADTALLLMIGALCGSVILKGAAAVFTFQPSSESLVFLAFLGAMVNDVYLLLFKGNFIKGGVMIYSSVAAAVLTLSLMARIAELKRVRNGYRALPENAQSYSIRRVELPDGIVQSDGSVDVTEVLYPVKKSLPEPDGNDTDAPLPSDLAAKVLSPVILLAALGVLGLNLFLQHGVYAGIASFAAVCCTCSPVFFSLGTAMPFQRVSRRLRKKKARITDYDTIDEIAGADSLVADAGLLFPPDTVSIHAIKTFSGVKIGKAILDAASVVSAANGPLSQPLIDLISEESDQKLEKVEGLTYNNEMGLTATIDRQRVLLGSRDLMRVKGIQTPSREYEAKYAAQGRDIFYLAVGDQLSAMFIAGYYSNKEILSSLKRLEHKGFSVFVKTNDANITPSLIADRMGEDYSSVDMLQNEDAKMIENAARATADYGLFFSGSISSFAEAVIACVRLKATMKAITVMQVVASALCMGFIAWCTLFTGMKIITPALVLEIQAILALPPFLVALLRKN